MSRLHRPASLRMRLFLSYAALVLLAVTLASGASLALYARQLAENARRAMVDEAEMLANLAAAAGGDTPISAFRLASVLYADPRVRDRPRPFLIVDAAGAPVLELWPPPDAWAGRNNRRGSATPARAAGRDGPDDRPGLPAPAGRAAGEDRLGQNDGLGTTASGERSNRPPGQPLLRRPRQFTELRYPPQARDIFGRQAIGEVTFPNGVRFAYVTVPLAVSIDARDTELAQLDAPPAPPLFLVVSRFHTELRGLWYPLLPSIFLVGSLALVLASVVAYILASSITRPLEAMTQASERIAAGNYAVRVSATGASEIGRLASAFNSMAHQVGEAQRRQREFVVNVSHDLRTPLTTIRGFARALLDGTAQTAAQQRTAAGAIESASDRMATLVETLIDLARLEDEVGGMQVQTVDAGMLLADVAEDHRHAAQAAGVALEVAVADHLQLRADPAWIARALGNLVDNAIQHSPPGARVRLVARVAAEDPGHAPIPNGAQAQAVDHGAPGRDRPIELAVEDRGAGIPPEDLPRVFERFYRGDRARSSHGSGLGLAIAREIVKGHGGDIAVESAPGRGTRVVLRLAGSTDPRGG